jgi:hypothetical protein
LKLLRPALSLLAALVAAPSHAASPPPVPVEPRASSSARRFAIAEHWAPTIYQETRGPVDLITAFDFDGDWDGSNNAEHLKTFPLYAVVYFTVAETATHWFVTYVLYHPVDGKMPTGHDHDTEHVSLVVRKDGDGFGRIEAMETRFHKVLYQYAAPDVVIGNGADDVDGPIHFDGGGRPAVYVQRTGHGICGGQSPTSIIDTLALRCHHREQPHIEKRGVVYRYTGDATAPRSLDDRSVGYALLEIGDTLWQHARAAGPHLTFASLIDFHGERCDRYDCPRGIGGLLAPARGHGSTGMPWEEGGGRGVKQRGDAFFDPAYTLSRRLRFPAPFATEYVFNPYLGIGSFPSRAGPGSNGAGTLKRAAPSR